MTKVDEIGKWSVDKLTMLQEYLTAYTNILKNTNKNNRWCKGCHYVDAFAGSVYPKLKEKDDIIEGSPLRALKVNPSFDSFIFIDINKKRIEENIEPLRVLFPDKNITTLCEDANDAILNKVLPRFCGKENPYRGFIFLDPYGLQLKWTTIEAIGKNRAYDILVNFSVMGVVRQLGDKKPLEHMESHITDVFGTDEWKNISYREDKQLTLFDTKEKILQRKKENLVEDLVEFYRERLKSIFPYVSDAVIMKNSKNGPLYSLVLASHASLAVKKMHEIFKRQQRKR